PLLGRLAVVFVGQEVLAGGEQVGAEPAAGAVGGGEVVLLQEAGEERLGQVLGGVVVVATAADISINRVPVQPAQVGQRLPGVRGGRVLSRGDQAPAGGGEHDPIIPDRRGRLTFPAAGPVVNLTSDRPRR